jgi:hypothetical protein
MTKPKAKSKKAQSVRMTINGQNSQVTVLQEISLFGPQGNHEICVTIAPVQLKDASSNPLFSGNISLQIKSAIITPGFFPIITRLLTPFRGYFDMDLSGTIINQTNQEVTIQVDDMLNIRIIPT